MPMELWTGRPPYADGCGGRPAVADGADAWRREAEAAGFVRGLRRTNAAWDARSRLRGAVEGLDAALGCIGDARRICAGLAGDGDEGAARAAKAVDGLSRAVGGARVVAAALLGSGVMDMDMDTEGLAPCEERNGGNGRETEDHI